MAATEMDVVEGEPVADDFEALDPEILAEYKAWKKNTPFLYDLVMTHSLEWPSLTVEWHSDVVLRDNRETHKMVLGTHTSGEEPNYLMVADVSLPSNEKEIDAKNFREDLGEVGSYGGSVAKVDVKVKMIHDGEVNRARINPHNTVPKPQHICHGHTKEGYGLNWSPLEAHQLLSGSDDATICLWDLKEAGLQVDALRTWKGHEDVIEDVAWHRFSPSIFGSVGDDSKLIVWDSRKEGKPIKEVDNAHNGDINCLSFNSFNENFLATGGSDNMVKIWDMRFLQNPMNTLEAHTDSVYQVNWSPHSETILASGSADRRICVWDLAKVGQEQTPEQAKEGPAELIFLHGGHTAKICDFAWNPNKPFTIGSVSEGHIMQVWSMSEGHYLRKTQGSQALRGLYDDDGIVDDDLEECGDNVLVKVEQLERKREQEKQ
eukprot:GSChrysophyteH2.ASY1.ANO1.1501.1 assembled CDS